MDTNTTAAHPVAIVSAILAAGGIRQVDIDTDKRPPVDPVITALALKDGLLEDVDGTLMATAKGCELVNDHRNVEATGLARHPKLGPRAVRIRVIREITRFAVVEALVLDGPRAGATMGIPDECTLEELEGPVDPDLRWYARKVYTRANAQGLFDAGETFPQFCDDFAAELAYFHAERHTLDAFVDGFLR